MHPGHVGLQDTSNTTVVISIISASLPSNIASVSDNGVDLSPMPSVGRLVGRSVCVSGKYNVAKRLIGSRCRLG